MDKCFWVIWIIICLVMLGCASQYGVVVHKHGEGDATRCVGSITWTKDMWSCVMFKGDE